MAVRSTQDQNRAVRSTQGGRGWTRHGFDAPPSLFAILKLKTTNVGVILKHVLAMLS